MGVKIAQPRILHQPTAAHHQAWRIFRHDMESYLKHYRSSSEQYIDELEEGLPQEALFIHGMNCNRKTSGTC